MDRSGQATTCMARPNLLPSSPLREKNDPDYYYYLTDQPLLFTRFLFFHFTNQMNFLTDQNIYRHLETFC